MCQRGAHRGPGQLCMGTGGSRKESGQVSISRSPGEETHPSPRKPVTAAGMHHAAPRPSKSTHGQGLTPCAHRCPRLSVGGARQSHKGLATRLPVAPQEVQEGHVPGSSLSLGSRAAPSPRSSGGTILRHRLHHRWARGAPTEAARSLVHTSLTFLTFPTS